MQVVLLVLVALSLTVALSWFESGTRTFTWQAETVVSVPVVAMFVLAALNRPRRSSLRTWLRALRSDVGARSCAEPGGPTERVAHRRVLANPASAPEPRTGLAVWCIWCVALMALELIELFFLPRSQHPTVSSILNPFLAGSRFVHAAAFFVWMWLGALFSSRW